MKKIDLEKVYRDRIRPFLTSQEIRVMDQVIKRTLATELRSGERL